MANAIKNLEGEGGKKMGFALCQWGRVSLFIGIRAVYDERRFVRGGSNSHGCGPESWDKAGGYVFTNEFRFFLLC